MYWATRLVFVCLMVTQVRCGNDQYGYVKWELVTQCITNPVNDVCPLGHKVPKRVYNIYPGILGSALRVSAKFRSAGGNDNCTQAATMFQCSQQIKTCKNNLSYFYWDRTQAYTLCIAARQACVGVDRKLQDTWLNCNRVRGSSEWRQTRRTASCREYPVLENDKCPKRNYKVVRANALQPAFLQDQNRLELLLRKSNVRESCRNNVFRAFCDYSAPACTKDEQFEVALLSKQKCLKILSCLKSGTTNAGLFDKINLHYVPCQYLSDENTAEKISMTKVYNPSTPTFKTPVYNLSTPTSIENIKEKMVSSAAACCKGSRLSVVGQILVVLIFWLFRDNSC